MLIAAALFELGAFRSLDAQLATFLDRAEPPASAHAVQYWCIILLGLGIAWTTVDVARTGLKFAIAAVAFAEVITAVWVLSLYHVFFSPFASLTAIAVALGLGLIYAWTPSGSRKRTLHQLLGERVSRKTLKALVNSRVPVKFEGEVREATIVGCEIFNRDELLGTLSAPEYVAMTNAFLRNAADFLVERGGYLDECSGETLRVVFGVPGADPQHAAHACAAALDLQARLEAVNRECEERWGNRFDYGIGVNSGEMVLAAYGSRRLGGLSITGEPVEFARRLCAANTIYSSRILIGSGTFAQAETTIEVRPIELIQRHRDDPAKEEVYELLACNGALSADEETRRDLFCKGIAAFREQHWDDALANFKLARELNMEDGPAEFYIRRIEQLRAGVASLDWTSS